MFATVCFMSFVPLHGKYSSQQLLPKFVMRSLVLLKQQIVFLGPGWLNNQAFCSQYPNHSPVVEPLPFLLLPFFPEQLSSVFSQHLICYCYCKSTDLLVSRCLMSGIFRGIILKQLNIPEEHLWNHIDHIWNILVVIVEQNQTCPRIF